MSFPTIRSVQWIFLTIAGAVGIYLWHSPLHAGEPPVLVPSPALDNAKNAGAPQTAVLSAGCFWGVQGVYEHVRGVKKVISGYAGGDRGTAQYETVSSGNTGHAESVKITFDPAEVSYGQLLQIAFSVVHDPTQLNRQGPDVGTQYRSAIFYADDEQRRVAEAYVRQLEAAKKFPRPIVTEMTPLKAFYPAESYHQDYLRLHPMEPYIVFNDLPKIASLKATYPALYR